VTLLTTRKGQAALIAGLVALFGLAYWLWGDFRSGVEEASGILARGDIPRMKAYLLSFGIWAPLVSATLMVFQSVAAPLPAFVITFANGLLFGAFWGTLLSWSSAMVGAAICYFIARALGRPVVERIVGGRSLALADRFFDRYGQYAVLIARLIPIVSFDVVSYAAGVTSVGFVAFMVATGIGQLPATVVYSVLGENLTNTARYGLWVFGAVAALLVLGLVVKTAYERRLAPEEVASGEGGSAGPQGDSRG